MPLFFIFMNRCSFKNNCYPCIKLLNNYMNELSEKSQVKLEVKTLIGIIMGIVSIAGIWFNLTAKISSIDSAIIRLEYNQSLNDEFRIKWPRGEMGALPDDAKQDLRIEYLQKDVENLILKLEELKEKNNKK